MCSVLFLKWIKCIVSADLIGEDNSGSNQGSYRFVCHVNIPCIIDVHHSGLSGDPQLPSTKIMLLYCFS